MIIRTLVVDDEKLARDRIKRLLRREPDFEVVGEAGNGPEAVDAAGRLKPRLIFLDVQMPGMNGFEVLKTLAANQLPAVVFTTAFETYAVRAFDAHAVDYLLKPIEQRRFRDALARVKEQLRSEESGAVDERLREVLDHLGANSSAERIAVRSDGRVLLIKVNDIDWIEADGNYVHLHTAERSHLHRATLRALESRLDRRKFVRIHRSTIANVDRIKELHPLFSGDYAVVLHSGEELVLSRTYGNALKRILSEDL